MNNKMERTNLRFCLTYSLLSASLLLGGGNPAQAQPMDADADELRYIEQPLALKAGITTAGIGLIGFELWWFLFSRTRAKPEETTQDAAASSESAEEKAFLNHAVLEFPTEETDDNLESVLPLPFLASILLNEESDYYPPQPAVGGYLYIHNGIEKAERSVLVEDKRCPKFS